MCPFVFLLYISIPRALSVNCPNLNFFYHYQGTTQGNLASQFTIYPHTLACARLNRLKEEATADEQADGNIMDLSHTHRSTRKRCRAPPQAKLQREGHCAPEFQTR
jgi:hypothetical protein